MNLARYTVSTRLYGGFGLVVALLLVLQGMVYTSFSRQDQAAGWNKHTYEVMIEVDAILTSLINIETGQRGFAVTGANNSLEPLTAGTRDFKKHLDGARTLTSDNAQQQERLRKLEELQRNWMSAAINPLIELRRQVVAGSATMDAVVALEQEGRGKRDMDAMRVLLADIRQAEATLLAARGKEMQSQTQWTKSTIVIGSIAGLVIGALCALWITRSLLKSLGGEPDYAASVAKAIAAGDLTVDVDVKSGDSASLLYAMKEMRDSLVRIVNEVRVATDAITSGSSQVADGSMDLSARTEQQASSLEETASSMEELTTTVKQNADNSRQANTLTMSASAIAQKGGDVVAEVVATMSAINQSSGKIADIISVIDGIAFQTNILALNAAVEAARAGEQGRGFAVVASEVRNLAQRSAAAAKEIKTLIHDSVEKVDSGTRLVDQAGATMQEIVGSIARVTDIVSEISAASGEQASGIEQINMAVTQMDEGTQQNAALVEEAAAAAQSMQDQSAHLARLVSVFKLPHGAPAAAAAPRKALAAVVSTSAPSGKRRALTASRARARSAEQADAWEQI